MSYDPMQRAIILKLEPEARMPSTFSAKEMAAISQAISLKRIADVLDGTAVGLNVTQTQFGVNHHAD